MTFGRTSAAPQHKNKFFCIDFVDLKRDSAIYASIMALAALSVRFVRHLKIENSERNYISLAAKTEKKIE